MPRRGRRSRRQGSARRRAISSRCSGLAGANLPEAAARIAALLPFGRMRIETDALIALRGALGPRDGLAAMLGTGSVFGRQRAGRIDIVGGWGFQLGDQGSGARLGQALLERALLAHDGLAEGSALLSEVIAEAGGPAALVIAMRDASPGRFAEYVPRLVAAAGGGDPGAAALLDAAAADVAGFLDGPRPRGVAAGLLRRWARGDLCGAAGAAARRAHHPRCRQPARRRGGAGAGAGRDVVKPCAALYRGGEGLVSRPADPRGPDR